MDEMFVEDVDIDDVHRCTLIHIITLVLNLGKHVLENFVSYNFSLAASEKGV